MKPSLYTPLQVFFSAYLGGPLGMMWVLKKNFDVLENKPGARYTLIGGWVFVIALFAAIPFIPAGTPRFVLPFAYSLLASYIAESHQMSAEKIENSGEYAVHSVWNVIGVIVVAELIFVSVFLAWYFFLVHMGAVQLLRKTPST